MSRKKHRILYVDDEPSHLWIFQKCFEKEYDILLAEDAEKGIDLFEFHPDIAVVLADQCMPGMSGVELMSRVFAINPYPIRILVTGHGSLQNITDAVNSGHIFQYVAKPWDEQLMRAVLRKATEIYALIVDNHRMSLQLKRKNEQLAGDLKKRRLVEVNLIRSQEHIRQLTRELLRVQENERHRIALDLHDKVAQDLSSLKLMVEAMASEVRTDASVITHWRKELLDVLQKSIDVVRDLSYTLRPPALSHFGLFDPLQEYCEEVAAKHNIRLDFRTVNVDHLSLPYETAINLYRLAQEAMNNICTHAEADRVQVELRGGSERLVLSLVDNGKGFDLDTTMQRALEERRMGLRSMDERIGLLHGLLTIDSKPGQGTVIRAEVPVV